MCRAPVSVPVSDGLRLEVIKRLKKRSNTAQEIRQPELGNELHESTVSGVKQGVYGRSQVELIATIGEKAEADTNRVDLAPLVVEASKAEAIVWEILERDVV